jgi:hypothetical protein
MHAMNNIKKENYTLFFAKVHFLNLLYLATRYTGCVWNIGTKFKSEFFITTQRKKVDINICLEISGFWL